MEERDFVTELYLIGLLERVQTELDHNRVFISSRERMHPVGLEDYDELHSEVLQAIQAYRGGKWQLHIKNVNDDLLSDQPNDDPDAA